MPKTRKRIAAVVCAVLMTSSCLNPLAVAAVDEYGTSSSEAVLFSGEAASDIEINETTFPDATFRQYVIDTINGGSTTLTAETINSVTEINVSGTSDAPNTISDLSGIEYFTKLENLNFQFNQVSSIDLSTNIALKNLVCDHNKFTELDLTNNTALELIWCGENEFTSLDFSPNTALTQIVCRNNPDLTSVNVSSNTKLTWLDCGNCHINSLNVSNNTALIKLICDRNQLTSLDVTNNTALTYLNFQFNQISSINLSNNAALNKLICDHNKFTELNLTNNSALDMIWCGENAFIALDFSPNTALKQIVCRNNPILTSVNVSSNTNLELLDCGNCPINSLDVSKNTVLETLKCDGDYLTSLDLSNNTALTTLKCDNNTYPIGDVTDTYSLTNLPTGFVPAKASNWTGAAYDEATNSLINFTSDTVTYDYECGNGKTATFTLTVDSASSQDVVEINETTFPDATFRKYVSEKFDTDKSGGLSQAELDAVTEINVSGEGLNDPNTVADLTGIEYFTNLRKLYCYYCQLTTLDVSKNNNLVTLWCYGNELTTLDVSKNTNLRVLWCYINQLTSLTVNNNLTWLDCHANKLTALDVSNCTKLDHLDCFSNKITNLNVNNNTELLYLDCSVNPLTSLNISNNTKLQTLDCSGIHLTTLNISNNTALTELDCSFNALTSFDIKSYPALKKLYCDGCHLTSLDVSNNPALTVLSCKFNSITSLDLSNCKALTKLYCTINGLTSLDLSNNTALAELECDLNGLASLDLSKNTALTALKCDNNTYSIGDVTDTYSLTNLPTGFVPAKASNWTGATYDAVNNCLKDFTSTTVTYTYDCGYGELVTFTLKASSIPTSADVVEINETTFPDATFRKGVSDNFDTDKSGGLSQEELDAVTFMYINPTNTISDLTGIEYFTNLEKLYCYNNHITSLDVSKNTALTELGCSRNQLTNLDVSNNTALRKLLCNASQLTSLDVSKNTVLETLICDNNKLTNLDLSKNTALTELSCSRNQLTSLDVSNNTALISLFCNANKLTSLDVSNNTALEELVVEHNPNLGSIDVSKNTALVYLNVFNCGLTSLDIKINTKLQKLYCYDNQLTSLDVSNNTALTELICDANQLTSLDVSKNTVLETLRCDNNQLTSLDLSNNTALTALKCDRNTYSIGDITDSYSLSNLPEGFDPAKASEWNGAEYKDGRLVCFTGIDGENRITYVYDCGNGKSAVFELKYTSYSHEHSFGEWRVTTPPSADNDGVKERECKVCGHSETEPVKFVPDEGDISNTTDKDKNACGGDLELTGKEISEQIGLTPEEREKIENGASVEVYLEVKEMTDNVPQKDKELIEKGSSDKQIGVYLDISLIKKIDDERTPVKNTKSEVTIKLTIPDKLINNDSKISREYFIIRVHDGAVSVITGIFNEGTKEFRFGTDCFSSYAIAYKDTVIEDPDPIEAFVDRLYTIILDRHAEAGGLADWTNRLKTGTATSAEIVYGIIFSPEYGNKGLSNSEAIERLYRAMLGRDSDPAGKEYWLDNLAGGLTITGIINGFSGSQEFGQICASYGIKAGNITDCEPRDRNIGLTGFVSRMYTKALGRNYDVEGLNDWTNRYLTGTATTADIAYGFIFSSEFQKKNLSDEDYVETLYETFFNRPSDAAGKADWLNRMHTQDYSREMVLNGFLEAPEFIALREGFGV